MKLGCRFPKAKSPKPKACYDLRFAVEYALKQYGLQQGALEIQYIEEFFFDFPRKKTAAEVINRLADRDHHIVMAEAPLPDDPGTVVPVSFKVGHELRANEYDPKLADLVAQLEDVVEYQNRRVLYQWIGGTRRDGRVEVESVAVTPAAAGALAAVLARHSDVPVHICEPSVLEAITGFDFHRGCLALARRPAAPRPLLEFAAASRLLALEGVGNPD